MKEQNLSNHIAELRRTAGMARWMGRSCPDAFQLSDIAERFFGQGVIPFNRSC